MFILRLLHPIVICLVLFMAHKTARARSSSILFYIDGSFLKVFSSPVSPAQRRLSNQVWRAFAEGCRADEQAAAATWTDYNPNWILDVIEIPCMKDVREKLLSQFHFLEKIVRAQDLEIGDLSREQAYQLADHFLALDDETFSFRVTEAPREAGGVLTDRNSLLAFSPTFVAYVLGRSINSEPVENRELLPQISRVILDEVPTDKLRLRTELQGWLTDLGNRSSLQNALLSVEFGQRLSSEAKFYMARGAEKFKASQIRDLQNFFANRDRSSSKALYDEVKAQQRQEFQKSDLLASGFCRNSLIPPGRKR